MLSLTHCTNEPPAVTIDAGSGTRGGIQVDSANPL
jgi:hypothetical protein